MCLKCRGGYSQFFFNRSGDFAYEILASLREVGANITAEIHRKALASFGCTLPKNRDEREGILDGIADGVDGVLSECDNEFYKYQDNLTDLNYQFALRNKAQFS